MTNYKFDPELFARVVTALLRGRTLEGVSEETGLSIASLSRFRTGSAPKLDGLAAICTAANVSPNTLFGASDCQTVGDAIAELGAAMERGGVNANVAFSVLLSLSQLVGSAEPVYVYEAVDVSSSDEMYFPVGIWATLDDAIRSLLATTPSQVSDWDVYEARATYTVSVRRRQIGRVAGFDREVATVTWEPDMGDTAETGDFLEPEVRMVDTAPSVPVS